MIRIKTVTIRPDGFLAYQHSQVVIENGDYRMAAFQHTRNDYEGFGDGRVRLIGLRYERQA
jgi:hypothetical protein